MEQFSEALKSNFQERIAPKMNEKRSRDVEEGEISRIIDYVGLLNHQQDAAEMFAMIKSLRDTVSEKDKVLEKLILESSFDQEVMRKELSDSKNDIKNKDAKIIELEKRLKERNDNKESQKRANTRRWLQTLKHKTFFRDPRTVLEVVVEALKDESVEKSVFCVLGGLSLCTLQSHIAALEYFAKGKDTKEGNGFDALCSMLLYCWESKDNDDEFFLKFPFSSSGILQRPMWLDWILICCHIVPWRREPLLSLAKPVVTQGYCDFQSEAIFWEESAALAIQVYFSGFLVESEKNRYRELLKQLASEYDSHRIRYVYFSLLFLENEMKEEKTFIEDTQNLENVVKNGVDPLFSTRLSDLDILHLICREPLLGSNIGLWLDSLDLKYIEWELQYDPLIKFMFNFALKRVAKTISVTPSKYAWENAWNAVPCNLRDRVDAFVLDGRKLKMFKLTQIDSNVTSYNARELFFKFNRLDSTDVLSQLPSVHSSCYEDDEEEQTSN